ncbi:MAG: asparagine synthetase B, partial [Bacteroidales bacterium]|nr:asparagine synthetase B [Bacteroidales bacterium]
MKKTIIFIATILLSINSFALYLLIPMDDTQTNHLKAYGISYWILNQKGEVSWLLNYRGGSFLVKYDATIEKQCKLRGVSYNNIADIQASQILNQIAEPEENMDVVKLQNAPRIAVYSPKNKLPWDDAVTLVLT